MSLSSSRRTTTSKRSRDEAGDRAGRGTSPGYRLNAEKTDGCDWMERSEKQEVEVKIWKSVDLRPLALSCPPGPAPSDQTDRKQDLDSKLGTVFSSSAQSHKQTVK